MAEGINEIATAWHRGSRLRLRFDKQADRSAMHFYLDDPSETLLLTSQEGTAQDRWPASPPLQSLALEPRGDNFVALAVGMAGGAHWSASIETLNEPHSLRFDYACRLGELPEFLGSTFQVSPGNQAANIIIEAIDGGELSSTGHLLQIIANPPQKLNSVWVARWRFTLRIAGE